MSNVRNEQKMSDVTILVVDISALMSLLCTGMNACEWSDTGKPRYNLHEQEIKFVL